MGATRDQILAAKDWDTTEIDIKDWGTLRIRTLSAQERLDLSQQVAGETATNEEAVEFYCRIIALSAIDDCGDLLFCEEDIPALKQRNWARIQFAAEAIMRFNGMGQDAIEEMEKN